MCEPVSMALMVGSAAVSAAGSLYAGAGASRVGMMQAEIANNNTKILKDQADIARENAKIALKRGAGEAYRVDAAVTQAVDSQTAHFGAVHLDPTVGSPLALAASSIAQGEIDKGLIRAHATADAAGAFVKGAQYQAEAATSSWQAAAALERGEQAKVAGYFGAATAILSAGSKWKSLGGGGVSAGEYDAWEGMR